MSYSGDDEGSSEEEEEGAEADWSETLKGGYDDDEVRFLSDSVDHSTQVSQFVMPLIDCGLRYPKSYSSCLQ